MHRERADDAGEVDGRSAPPCARKRFVTGKKLRPRWTVKRLSAVINAVTAMQAGEEGEGDWDPDNSADDLQAGLEWLQAEHARLMPRTSKP